MDNNTNYFTIQENKYLKCILTKIENRFGGVQINQCPI